MSAVLSAVPEEYRADYARLLQSPGDLEIMYTMAQRFERGGLYTEALRLYERMLLLEDDLPAARLSAALVEQRIGNSSAALAHLELISPGSLSPSEAGAARLLREEAEKSVRRHRIDGRVQFGLRYNTNANAAPFELDEEFEASLLNARESDFAAFADLSGLHIFNPRRQDAITFETSFRLFGKKQFEIDEFDTLYARAATGPRFRIQPGRPNRLTLRPYLFGDGYLLDGEIYSAAPGLGVEFRDRPHPRLEIAANLEAEWVFYGSAAEAGFFEGGTAQVPLRDPDELDGLHVEAEFFAGWSPIPELTLAATPLIGHRDADLDRFRRTELGIRLGATLALDIAGSLSDRPALATLYGSYKHFDYSGGSFREGTEREDHLWEIGGTAEMPFGERLSAFADMRWHRTSSALRVYEWEDVQTSLGIDFRF